MPLFKNETLLGSTDECIAFGNRSPTEFRRWWYHGTTRSKAIAILEGVVRFKGKEVHLSSNPVGDPSKGDHTHVVRAGLDLSGGRGQEWGTGDAWSDPEHEWIVIRNQRLEMFDQTYCGEIEVIKRMQDAEVLDQPDMPDRPADFCQQICSTPGKRAELEITSQIDDGRLVQ